MDVTGQEYTDSQAWQISELLEISSRKVQLETGQKFTSQTHTWMPKSVHHSYVLPQRPVTSITSVKNTDGNDIEFLWDGLDTVYLTFSSLLRFDLEPLVYSVARIVIIYTAGYMVVPEDIKGICIQMALRAYGTRPEDSGITQEAITSYSYQRGQASAAGAIGLLPLEKEALRRYRVMQRSVRMGR
jgi:hypothetical protein